MNVDIFMNIDIYIWINIDNNATRNKASTNKRNAVKVTAEIKTLDLLLTGGA